MLYRLLFVFLAVLSLVACNDGGGSSEDSAGGGGTPGQGGDEEDPVVDPITRTQFLELDEKASHSLSVPDFLDRGSLSVESEDEFLAHVGVNDGVLTVEAEALDRPRTAEVVLTDAFGNMKTITIALENVSGYPVRARAEAWLDAGDDLLALTEDARLYRHHVDLAYFRQAIDSQDQDEQHEAWSTISGPGYAVAEQALEELSAALDDYRQGEISEQPLADAADTARTAVNDHANHGQVQVTEVREPNEDLVTFSPFPTYEFRQAHGAVSRYIGNDALGFASDDEWFFFDEYKHLIVAIESGVPATCTGEAQ